MSQNQFVIFIENFSEYFLKKIELFQKMNFYVRFFPFYNLEHSLLFIITWGAPPLIGGPITLPGWSFVDQLQ